MTKITFFASGLPKGQPRPRAFARKIGDKFMARVYDSGTAENWKSQIAVAAHPFSHADINEPCRLEMTFFFPRPRSHYRAGKHAGELKESAPVWMTTRPDCDNLSKAVLDCLVAIGILRDDACVVQIETEKAYAPFSESVGCRVTIDAPALDPHPPYC